MQNPDVLLYQEVSHPKLQARVLTNWSKTDVWVLVVILLELITSGLWIGTGSSPSLAMVIVVFEMSMLLPLLYRFPKGYGRLYDEIVVGVGSDLRFKILGSVDWMAEPTDGRFKRWLRDRNGKRSALPIRLDSVQATTEEGTFRYAMLRHTDRPYDFLYARVHGGALASLNPNDLARGVADLATIMNQICTQSSLKAGFTLLRASCPGDQSGIKSMLQTNGNPVIADPSKFELSPERAQWVERMRRNAAYLMPVAASHGAAETWSVIAISIKRDRHLWRKAKRSGLTDDQLYELPIVELGRELVQALESSPTLGLDQVHIMGTAELAQFMRISLDVVNLEDYYHKRAIGQIPRTDEELDKLRKEKGDQVAAEALECFPDRETEIPRDGTWMKIDDTYIATVRVTKLPEKVRADQYLAIQHLPTVGTWTRQAMVGEGLSGATETRNLVVASSAHANVQAAFTKNRVVESPSWRKRRHNLSRQTEEISANSVVQHFNQLHPVLGTTPRQALKEAGRLVARLQASGWDAEIVAARGRQKDVVISGCLGANRM